MQIQLPAVIVHHPSKEAQEDYHRIQKEFAEEIKKANSFEEFVKTKEHYTVIADTKVKGYSILDNPLVVNE